MEGGRETSCRREEHRGGKKEKGETPIYVGSPKNEEGKRARESEGGEKLDKRNKQQREQRENVE